jgi:hypothetical protein
LTLIPLFCVGQKSKNSFFGIELDSDWYTLTNQQALNYWIQDQEKNSNYVITDFSHIREKFYSKFLNLGLKELLLIFPQGYKGNLNVLKPDMFLARIRYSNVDDYWNKSNNDVKKILSLLNNVYDKPELNMIREKFSVYKWKGLNSQIILTCREDELTTTLIYSKE